MSLSELGAATHVTKQSALEISNFTMIGYVVTNDRQFESRWNFIWSNIQNFPEIVSLNPNADEIHLEPIIPNNFTSAIPQK